MKLHELGIIASLLLPSATYNFPTDNNTSYSIPKPKSTMHFKEFKTHNKTAITKKSNKEIEGKLMFFGVSDSNSLFFGVERKNEMNYFYVPKNKFKFYNSEIKYIAEKIYPFINDTTNRVEIFSSEKLPNDVYMPDSMQLKTGKGKKIEMLYLKDFNQ